MALEKPGKVGIFFSYFVVALCNQAWNSQYLSLHLETSRDLVFKVFVLVLKLFNR